MTQGLGTNDLTALNLAISIYHFVYDVEMLLGMGGAIKYSICQSQREQKNADIMFTNTIYLAIMFSILFFVTGLCFQRI